MKWGLIARCDNSGLGVQTWDVYRHLKPDKTLVVDLSKHSNRTSFPERYPDATFVYDFPNWQQLTDWMQGLDLVYCSESPYNHELYTLARERGIKTATTFNFEFLTHLQDTGDHRYPDKWFAPSLWNEDRFPENVDYLPVPVDRDLLPYKQRTTAKTFLHVVGRRAQEDRNGTDTLLKAMKFVRGDITLRVRLQEPENLKYFQRMSDDPRIEWITQDTDNYWEIYGDADVLVLPRKYGGLCLPMQEALSLGMPVIMTNVSPNDHILPPSWRVSAQKRGEIYTRMPLDIWEADERELAQTIDRFANMTTRQMAFASRWADKIATRLDWAVLEPLYREKFSGII